MAGLRLVSPLQCDGLLHQKFGAAAGNKNARTKLNPEPAKACPAQDLLQREAGDT